MSVQCNVPCTEDKLVLTGLTGRASQPLCLHHTLLDMEYVGLLVGFTLHLSRMAETVLELTNVCFPASGGVVSTNDYWNAMQPYPNLQTPSIRCASVYWQYESRHT